MHLHALSENQPALVLSAGADAILGRDQSANYVVVDPTVSRRHAMLTVRDGLLFVTDLASANGSFVNGTEVRDITRAAAPGDLLQFGSVYFRLESAAVAPPSQPMEPAPATCQPAPVARARSSTVLGVGLAQRDMLLARQIQMAMARSHTIASGSYALRQLYRPARELSGDLLLYTARKSGELWAVLGDVCDKGLPSALLSAFITGAARGLIHQVSSPAALLDELGEMMHDLALPGMFATAIALVVDTRKHRCEIALAGHAAALLRRTDGTVVELTGPPGTALAAAPAEQTVAQRISLAPGECLLLSSDGVDECLNEAGEPFGMERMHAVLRDNSPAAVIDQMEKALLDHRGNREWHDDVTMLSITRTQ